MKVTESDNLKHRKLRLEDYLQMVSAEQKEYAEVCGSPKMTKTDNTNTNKQTEGLLEQILSRENLNRAYKQVKRNKGVNLPWLNRHAKRTIFNSFALQLIISSATYIPCKFSVFPT